jgi:chemotaxis protein CheD
MKEYIYVNTGEVRSGGSDFILNSGAIGSCVVITAFDPLNNVGGMAHVMLPGTDSTNKNINAFKNAHNALEELLNQLRHRKVKEENIEFCMIGGANVLKRKNDSIGKENIASIENLLIDKGLKVCSRELGGFERRTALLDIEKGCIYITVGDSKQIILWQTKANNK